MPCPLTSAFVGGHPLELQQAHLHPPCLPLAPWLPLQHHLHLQQAHLHPPCLPLAPWFPLQHHLQNQQDQHPTSCLQQWMQLQQKRHHHCPHRFPTDQNTCSIYVLQGTPGKCLQVWLQPLLEANLTSSGCGLNVDRTSMLVRWRSDVAIPRPTLPAQRRSI